MTGVFSYLVTQTVGFVPNLSPSASSSFRTNTRIYSDAGFIKTVSKPGSSTPVNLGDIATVKYTCYLAENPTVPPFARAQKQKMVSDSIPTVRFICGPRRRRRLLDTIMPGLMVCLSK